MLDRPTDSNNETVIDSPSSESPAQKAPTTAPEGQSYSMGWLHLPPMRYPNEYVWFLLFSSMDIMLTWTILLAGGHEVNPIAALVIHNWDLPGAIAFKFGLMLVVVMICEILGGTRPRAGRNLAQLAVLVSCLPVLFSMALLLMHVWSPAVH